jgi:hypothetical protein
VKEAFSRAEQIQEARWTESIAVESRSFVETAKGELGMKAKGRRISGTDAEFSLSEPGLLTGLILRARCSFQAAIARISLDFFDNFEVLVWSDPIRNENPFET